MGEPLSPSRFEDWAKAQAAAVAAEQRIAQLAAASAAGHGPAPMSVELQSALILRAKASSLLMAVVSEGQALDAERGIVTAEGENCPT